MLIVFAGAPIEDNVAGLLFELGEEFRRGDRSRRQGERPRLELLLGLGDFGRGVPFAGFERDLQQSKDKECCSGAHGVPHRAHDGNFSIVDDWPSDAPRSTDVEELFRVRVQS